MPFPGGFLTNRIWIYADEFLFHTYENRFPGHEPFHIFFENEFWKSCLHANIFRSYAFHFLKCVNNFHAYEIGYPVTEIENPIYEMMIPVNEIDFKNMNSELTWMHTNIKLFK